MRWRQAIAPLLVALLTVALFLPPAAADWREAPWQSFEANLWSTHHVAGLIWSPTEARELKPEELVSALASKRFVLLGELHDNPDHHRLQAWLVSQLKPAAVVLEMVDVDQAAALEAAQAAADWQPAGLGAAVDWEQRGWPSWPTYQPIAEAAKATGAKLVAGNAERAKARALVSRGLDALDRTEMARLDLDQPLPATIAEALQAEIALAHCDLLPESLLPSMALAQRLRDATMADRLLAAAGRGGRAILITGNGHARRDRGVPFVLAGRDVAPAEIVSVMLVEVDPEAGTAADLVPLDAGGNPVADYIWITPAVSRPDHCEEMEKQLQGGSGG
jgi:uncharacterized iron-regulated protein